LFVAYDMYREIKGSLLHKYLLKHKQTTILYGCETWFVAVAKE